VPGEEPGSGLGGTGVASTRTAVVPGDGTGSEAAEVTKQQEIRRSLMRAAVVWGVGFVVFLVCIAVSWFVRPDARKTIELVLAWGFAVFMLLALGALVGVVGPSNVFELLRLFGVGWWGAA
jgi:hypothetical protein